MDTFEYKAKRINFKGYEIQTYVFGEGDNVIFSFPSYPHSGLYYIFFTKFYKKQNFKFITFDLPGWSGWSHNLFKEEGFDLNTYTDIAEEILNHYKVDKFSLIGYSFGGAMSVLLAKRRVNQIKSMVLVSPVIFGDIANGTYEKRMINLAHSFRAYSIFTHVIRSHLKAILPELYSFISMDLLDMYLTMFLRADKIIMLDSVYRLFNSKMTTDDISVLDQIPNVLVVNSETEAPLFRKQAGHLRRVLKNNSSFKIRGTHDDFILKPKAETVQKVMEFLVNS